jgi:hypothetical protein
MTATGTIDCPALRAYSELLRCRAAIKAMEQAPDDCPEWAAFDAAEKAFYAARATSPEAIYLRLAELFGATDGTFDGAQADAMRRYSVMRDFAKQHGWEPVKVIGSLKPEAGDEVA